MKQHKVLFPFEFGAESMWADDMGNHRYRLDNVPLFAYGISYGDEFAARRDEDRLVFDRVLSRRGAWTYRATLNEGFSDAATARDLLEDAKSHASPISQYGDDHFAFSVDVDDDRKTLESILDRGARCGFWDWEISSSAENGVDRK